MVLREQIRKAHAVARSTSCNVPMHISNKILRPLDEVVECHIMLRALYILGSQLFFHITEGVQERTNNLKQEVAHICGTASVSNLA